MSGKLSDKRAQRLRGETGTIIKHGQHDLSVAIVYPNTYFVGMSNLGFQFVYRLFNERDDVLCERAFLPDREELPELERTGQRLITLESGRPLADFDIIAFSIPFENDYPNILAILDLAGLPLLASERGENDPLVIAGGVTAFLNPEPITDFIDTFLIGEGECLVPSLIDACKGAKGKERAGLISELSGIEGFYVPSQYDVSYNDDGTVAACRPRGKVPQKVRRQWLDLEAVERSGSGSVISTQETEFGGMHLVEVGRGCGRGCRFCAAGFIYLPPRERKVEALQKEFEEGISKGERIGLVSPSLADHPDIEAICAAIHEADGSSSLSSVRADMLKEGYLRHIKEGGQKTVTVAPEAGTERLRDVINKGLSDDDIFTAVRIVAQAAIPNIRFYFMIGLPGEREEDIDGIIELSRRCRDIFIDESRVHGKVGSVTLSVNCFVPKPFTPFQWHPMEDERSLKEKLKRIKKALGREANINMISDLPKWAHIQGLLSRGDRRLGKLLCAVHRNKGDWKRSLKECGTSPGFYTTRPRPKDELFPWEVLDMGLEKVYLWKEYQRGLEGKTTPPCNIGPCTRCGVC